VSLTIAIGSANAAKVSAVRRAVRRAWPDAHLVPLAVASGVPEMPFGEAEGQRGALHRARAALEAADADLAIGMEGAVDERADAEGASALYLTNWVAVVAKDGRHSLAQGGSFPLPGTIARELRAGAELGPVMDRISGQRDSKQHLGAAGILTRGLVPRSLTFYVGVGLALAPFLRPDLYSPDVSESTL
jgi:inosine/xanthosine triphosphatase